jgi:hypothetical protein
MMKYLFFVISAFALTACQTETPMEWKARRAIEEGAAHTCRDMKGKEQYSTCYDREVRGRKQFYDDIMFRYAGVPKR